MLLMERGRGSGVCGGSTARFGKSAKQTIADQNVNYVFEVSFLFFLFFRLLPGGLTVGTAYLKRARKFGEKASYYSPHSDFFGSPRLQSR